MNIFEYTYELDGKVEKTLVPDVNKDAFEVDLKLKGIDFTFKDLGDSGEALKAGYPFTVPSTGQELRIAVETEDSVRFMEAEKALQVGLSKTVSILFTTGDVGKDMNADDLNALFLEAAKLKQEYLG